VALGGLATPTPNPTEVTPPAAAGRVAGVAAPEAIFPEPVAPPGEREDGNPMPRPRPVGSG